MPAVSPAVQLTYTLLKSSRIEQREIVPGFETISSGVPEKILCFSEVTTAAARTASTNNTTTTTTTTTTYPSTAPLVPVVAPATPTKVTPTITPITTKIVHPLITTANYAPLEYLELTAPTLSSSISTMISSGKTRLTQSADQLNRDPPSIVLHYDVTNSSMASLTHVMKQQLTVPGVPPPKISDAIIADVVVSDVSSVHTSDLSDYSADER